MDIKNLLEMATQARLDAEESKVKLEQDEAHNMSLNFIIRQLPYYKRYYLKKNQPGNYFRLTQIIPPDSIDYPQTWRHRFQVWRPGHYKPLAIDEPITREAYEFLSAQPKREVPELNTYYWAPGAEFAAPKKVEGLYWCLERRALPAKPSDPWEEVYTAPTKRYAPRITGVDKMYFDFRWVQKKSPNEI